MNEVCGGFWKTTKQTNNSETPRNHAAMKFEFSARETSQDEEAPAVDVQALTSIAIGVGATLLKLAEACKMVYAAKI